MRARDINWGNWISVLRIGLALVFIASFRSTPGHLLTLSIFAAVLAQITDHLDGYLVRIFSAPSLKGWIVDSIADRAFYIAALLAFEREYELNEILVWVFILREICLYAIRIIAGDFEAAMKGFRRLALIHAALVRAGIVVGCLVPYELFPVGFKMYLLASLPLIFGLATAFGFYNLYVLFRRLP